MSTWMTLKELGGADTMREYKVRYGQSIVRQFKFWQPFEFHFCCLHQVDDHNNRIHSPISIERTWAAKFCSDRKSAWYLAVTGVNTALADGHFHKGRKLIQTLKFRRKFAHEIMENSIGVGHRWDLPVLRYHEIMVIYPYPFLVVITQLFSCIIFIHYCICILTGSPR